MIKFQLAAMATGYALWFAAAWALANRLVVLLARIGDERRRRRHARQRMGRWRPRARARDPGHDETKVMPAIQRPRGDGASDRS